MERRKNGTRIKRIERIDADFSKIVFNKSALIRVPFLVFKLLPRFKLKAKAPDSMP